MASNRILVTGYGGFLGSAICRRLLSEGFSVRGVARKNYPELQALGVEVVAGDLSQASVVEEVCSGVRAIIHTAALAGVWGPRRMYEASNLRPTLLLLESARRHRMEAFVNCSSPSVVFDGKDQRGIGPDAPYPKRWLCEYPRSKALAERAVLESNGREGLRTVSLRPHLIWGRNDPHLIPRLVDRAISGKLRRIGNGMNEIDTVHVDAAAEAHCLALKKLLDGDEQVAAQAFFVSDGEPVLCWQWIAQLLERAKVPVPRKSLSFTTAYILGGCLEATYQLLRRSAEPPMTRFVAAQLAKAHYYDIRPTCKMLGYAPIEDRALRLDAMQDWLESLKEGPLSD